MSESTQRKLAEIAEAMSTPEWHVTPTQVAAQLLEEAVRQVVVPSRRSIVMSPVQNPWERLPQREPFVLPEEDAAHSCVQRIRPREPQAAS